MCVGMCGCVCVCVCVCGCGCVGVEVVSGGGLEEGGR